MTNIRGYQYLKSPSEGGGKQQKGRRESQSGRRGSVTTTTDASFENLVQAATTGIGELFNTSMSTIHTTPTLEGTSPKAARHHHHHHHHRPAAEPEGTIFAEDYAGFYTDSIAGTGQLEERINVINESQEQGGVLPEDVEDVNTTCPTDSHSFDDSSDHSNDRKTSTGRLQYDQHRIAMKNRVATSSGKPTNLNDSITTTFHDDSDTTTATNKKSCCRNCTYWLLCVAAISVCLAVGGAVFIFFNIYGQGNDKSPNNVTTDEHQDTIANDTTKELQPEEDLFELSPTLSPSTLSPSYSPSQRPSQAPSLRPSQSPSSAPSAAPSIQNSGEPTEGPTLVPTSPPSYFPSAAPSTTPSTSQSSSPTNTPGSIGPTNRPSSLPTNFPSAVPTTAPPTRPPVDLSDSPYLIYLQDVVANPNDLLDVNTPQGRALEWLEYEDQVELDILKMTHDGSIAESRKRRMLTNLYQRYALVTLDYALHNDLESRTRWSFSRLNVCVWTGVKCNSRLQVESINWARKNLTGTIPQELGLLTNLKSLDIAQNKLKGSIEPIYKLTDANDIFVFENQITGPLTRGLENCRNLTRFMAGYNQLTGTLPSLQMRNLLWFNVHHNRFTGSIPSSLALDKAKIFDISNNQISGSIPSTFVEYVVPNIRHLYLGNNQIDGTVPEDFVNLGKGRVLQIYLNDNYLTGGFPTNFETIKHLTNLDLSKNLFRTRLGKMCRMSVFEYGELVEMRADCRICNCGRICRTCYDNIDYAYEYDDDEWIFDDDTLLDDDGDDDGDDDDDVDFTVWKGDDNDDGGDDDDDDDFVVLQSQQQVMLLDQQNLNEREEENFEWGDTGRTEFVFMNDEDRV